MINQFANHASNENNYMSWIRTAISIATFGFMVEKFDIFLAEVGHALHDKYQHANSVPMQYIGLGLIGIAVLLILGATVRFYRNTQRINSEHIYQNEDKWLNAYLGVTMFVLAIALLFYLWHSVLNQTNVG